EYTTEKWIAHLTERAPPPLAIIGGDSSYWALQLAKALKDHAQDWRGEPPLFLVTTATVDQFVNYDDEGFNVPTTNPNNPWFIEVYRGRTFRFSFTNTRMTEVVLDFVRDFHQRWPSPRSAAGDVAAVVGADGPLAAALMAGAAALDPDPPPRLYCLKWWDDSYS